MGKIDDIEKAVEKKARSLWASRTIWVSSLIGLLLLAQEYADVLPENYVRYAAMAAGVLTVAFRVQDQFYQQARKAAKAREHERAMTFEPHVPAE